jgi:hypothetical protein
MRIALSILALFLAFQLTQPARADEIPEGADSFLSFESLVDGYCHNLSERGKLRVMKNNHPSLPIRYRLIRYFVDVRQRGRTTGTVEPGGSPTKLGCTLVGGRPQRWEVERAEFIEEQPE